ncbi:MAG: MATE family efflux transporter [Rikenellaceae bacterium]
MRDRTSYKDVTYIGEKRLMPLLLEFALPSIIAMIATSLYNMVDSIFIGHGVGAMAISGLAVVFPLMNLGAAFGSLVGMGGSVFISLSFGRRNYLSAQYILGNIITLCLIIGVGFSLIILSNLDWVLTLFGASEATLPYARDYARIIMYGNVITHLYMGLNGAIRSAGYPMMSMMATVGTVVINTILDPIFIYIFEWGIKGAAIATIIAQAIMLAWEIYVLSDRSKIIHIRTQFLRLRRHIVSRIFGIGASQCLLYTGTCIVAVLINRGLMYHGGAEGDLNVGAYGIVNRFVFLFLMVVMGLNQGMQPIAGYNYGAKKFDRVIRVYIYTLILASMITITGFIIAQFAPRFAVVIFTSNEDLIRLSVDGLRCVLIMFPIVAFQMVTSNLFQCIGRAQTAIILSLTRQVLILMPMLYILPWFFGKYTTIPALWGIWYSMPLSDLLSSMLTGVMLVLLLREFKQKAE